MPQFINLLGAYTVTKTSKKIPIVSRQQKKCCLRKLMRRSFTNHFDDG